MREFSNKNGRVVMVRCDTCRTPLFTTAIPEWRYSMSYEGRILPRATSLGWFMGYFGDLATCPSCRSILQQASRRSNDE